MRALVDHTDASVIAITGDAGCSLPGLDDRKKFRVVNLKNDSLMKFVAREGLDIIHSPVQYFPNLTFSVPMVSTLHDLQHIHFPEFFSKEELDKRAILYKQSAVFAERVVVSFQHVKDDIVAHYGIPADKIDVCSLGMDRPKPPDEAVVRAAQKQHNVKAPYLFYSANTWRHKNHLGLIKAFDILRKRHVGNISLVCTGQKTPDYFPVIEEEIKKLGLDEFVKFTGYISEADVRSLLKGASLAVIPTLYEAGSFPLIEAMALEVPVICSNVTSLPDTIGDERFVFDPANAESIAGKMAAMLNDEKLRAENIVNSKKMVSGFGWEKAAGRFVESYEKAVEGFAKREDTAALREKMRSYEIISAELNLRLRSDTNALLNSLSWKLTAPLRTALSLLKR
ncbi:MAG: glycosyltransferase family 4 protein [Deltaproteobacteria bacterium]|nr:glycosyltransferase family 4 protein [Deltaproteobacteria bacterium]